MRQLICKDTGFTMDKEELFTRLHEREDIFDRACEILEAVQGDIHPCYVAKEMQISDVQPDCFQIDDMVFNSKITSLKLTENKKKNVFIYIVSCGRKIGDRLDQETDLLDQSILDIIAYMAYLRASDALNEALEKEFGMERHLRFCPGSIIDWSVGDNRFFFPLLDGLWQELDLDVLNSGLIIPLKSTAGILYETDDEFESCAICPRPNCPTRKLPYEVELHEQMANL